MTEMNASVPGPTRVPLEPTRGKDTGSCTSTWQCKIVGIDMDEGSIKTPIPKCRIYWCFCLGWSSNFVESESGQKHIVLNSCRIRSAIQLNTPRPTPSPPSQPKPNTVCRYFTVLWEGGEGWGRSERRERGASSQEGSKIPT
jgi:hypothetical protein